MTPQKKNATGSSRVASDFVIEDELMGGDIYEQWMVVCESLWGAGICIVEGWAMASE